MVNLHKIRKYFLSPVTLSSIADMGETTAAPAAAIVAFLIKSLLSILMSFCVISQNILNLGVKIRNNEEYLLPLYPIITIL